MTAIGFLGIYEGTNKPSEVALGFFYVPNRGYFARVWQDNFGPFETTEQAIDKVYQVLYPYPPIPEFRWKPIICILGFAWGAAMLLIVHFMK